MSTTKKWKWKFNYDWSIIMGTSYLWFYHDILQFPNSGKPHRIKIHVNLGIAHIAFGLPPHSNGQFLLKIFNSAGPKMCKGNVIWTRQARKPKEILRSAGAKILVSSRPGLSPTISWKWPSTTLSLSFGLFPERNHSFGVFPSSELFKNRPEYASVTHVLHSIVQHV